MLSSCGKFQVFFRIPSPILGNKNRSFHSYVVYLKISSKLLITCNFIDPMDANGDVGAGFSIAYIKYSATLVVVDNTGIFIVLREKIHFI